MHPSPHFRWEDRAAALAFVAEVSFAHVFVQTPDGPRVAHVPVLVEGEVLRFHLANANALTPHLDGAVALASVAGPNGYVSPNWYASQGRVPTWNYVAVECEGPVRALSPDELVALLDASAATHEPRVRENWTRAKMDPARFEDWTRMKMDAVKFDKMCRAITGFELLATRRFVQLRKLSQDSSPSDRVGVIRGTPMVLDDIEMASLVTDRSGSSRVTRLAVFDCDGTLVDSQANIVRAMAGSFAAAGLAPPEAHAVRRIVGLSLVEAMQVLLPDADAVLHANLAADFKRGFAQLRADDRLDPEPLYPGVREGLEALAADGWSLAVATGKSDRGLGLLLDHHLPRAPFRLAADRRPASVEAASVDAARRDRRRRGRMRRRP